MVNVDRRQHTSDRVPATAYLLTGCVAIFGSNSLVLGPIAPQVGHAFGSSTSTVMTATAAFGLSTALSALLFARHIDRVGAWRVLQITLFVLAGALLLRPLLIACAAFNSAFYGIYGFLGDHLHTHLDRPLSANGLVALIYGCAFGSAAPLDGFLDRAGARRMLPLALLAVTAVYLCVALASASFAGLLATTFAWGLANHVALNTLIMRLTAIDPAMRGTLMGLNSAVASVAIFAGTVGFGVVYANLGFVACAVDAAGLTLIATLAGAWPAPSTHAALRLPRRT